ncbi:hypothetical protein [Moraxella lacunata]|uniref:hypothetical protein n=1 Tax=Moraxella lacunata TaxID=477 RepID=UPI003EDFDC5C
MPTFGICNKKCLFKKAGESPVFQGKNKGCEFSIRQVFIKSLSKLKINLYKYWG